jgi:uncharacterized cofD-like protein
MTPVSSDPAMSMTPVDRPVHSFGLCVVAVGGGYGLSTTLRAIRQYATEVTGIVSVADDGGSSGRLRQAFGIPAPGDLRRCVVALAADGARWATVLEHRFAASELEGHAVGNILIAGLTETLGSFKAAIEAMVEMVGGQGRLIPATVDPVVLKATFRDVRGAHHEVEGEAAVGATAGITALSLVPPDPEVHAEAVDAIREADQIVLGPGSLYTSLLAVLGVPQLRDAYAASRARKIYVANLAEQHPETTGYDVARHVLALRSHGVEVDYVLRDAAAMPLGHVAGVHVVDWPIAAATGRLHDPDRLAEALAELAPTR